MGNNEKFFKKRTLLAHLSFNMAAAVDGSNRRAAAGLVREFDRLLGRPPFRTSHELIECLVQLEHFLQHTPFAELPKEKDIVHTFPIIASSLPHGFTAPQLFASIETKFVETLCRCLVIVAPAATYSLTSLLKELRTNFVHVGDVVRLHAAAKSLDDETVAYFLRCGLPSVALAPAVAASKGKPHAKLSSAGKGATAPASNPSLTSAVLVALMESAGQSGLLSAVSVKAILQKVDTPSKFRSQFAGDPFHAARALQLCDTHKFNITPLTTPMITACLDAETLPYFIRTLNNQTSLTVVDSFDWAGDEWDRRVTDDVLVRMIRSLSSELAADYCGTNGHLFCATMLVHTATARSAAVAIETARPAASLLLWAVRFVRSSTMSQAESCEIVLLRLNTFLRLVRHFRKIVESLGDGYREHEMDLHQCVGDDLECISARIGVLVSQTLSVAPCVAVPADSSKGKKKDNKEKKKPAEAEASHRSIDLQALFSGMVSLWLDWGAIARELMESNSVTILRKVDAVSGLLLLIEPIGEHDMRNETASSMEQLIHYMAITSEAKFLSEPVVLTLDFLLRHTSIARKLLHVAKSSPHTPLSDVLDALMMHAATRDTHAPVLDAVLVEFIDLLLTLPSSPLLASVLHSFNRCGILGTTHGVTLLYRHLRQEFHHQHDVETIIRSVIDEKECANGAAQVIIETWHHVRDAIHEEATQAMERHVEAMKRKIAEADVRRQRHEAEQRAFQAERDANERRKADIAAEAQRRLAVIDKRSKEALAKRKQAALDRLVQVQLRERETKKQKQMLRDQQVALFREKMALSKDLVEFLKILGLSEAQALNITSVLHHKLTTLHKDDVLEFVVTGSLEVPEDMKQRKEEARQKHLKHAAIFSDELTIESGASNTGFWKSVLEAVPQTDENASQLQLTAEDDLFDGVSNVKNGCSFHRRLAPLLDLFDFSWCQQEDFSFVTSEDCATMFCIPLATIKAVLDAPLEIPKESPQTVHSPSLARQFGYDDAVHMVFAAKKCGLLQVHVIDDLGSKNVCLTPLGVSYHEPFWHEDGSLQKLLDQRVHEARQRLSEAVQLDEEEDDFEDFGANSGSGSDAEDRVLFSDEMSLM